MLRRSHLPNESMDVVTNQKEFLAVVVIGGVHGQFCGRQPKNEPAFTGVDIRKLEHIPEKSSIRGRVSAIDNDMGTSNHSFYQI